MKGLNPNPKTDQELRENLRVLTELSEELYFKPTFYAGDGSTSAGAVFVSTTVPGVSTVEFPAAGQPAWRTHRVRQARWQNAAVRITLRYTAVVGSTNNFVLWLKTREHDTGNVFGTASVPDLFSQKLVLPGPAVANTEMVAVFVSSGSAINGAKPGVSFIHFRDKTDAADTNANSLHVISVEWEVIPL